jgi:hypothetical protein
MEGVSFNEEPQITRGITPLVKKEPVLVHMVIQSGIAKTSSGANAVLLGIAIIGFIITAFFIFGASNNKGSPSQSAVLKTSLDKLNAEAERQALPVHQ